MVLPVGKAASTSACAARCEERSAWTRDKVDQQMVGLPLFGRSNGRIPPPAHN
jgi:hypothetical protein